MRPETIYLIVQCCAYFVMGTASATILGYAAEEAQMRKWVSVSSEMALPTAVSLLCIGVALILVNIRSQHGTKRR